MFYLETIVVHHQDFGSRTTLLWMRVKLNITSKMDRLFVWCQMLIISFLLKLKQINDDLISKIQEKPLLSVLSRILILHGVTLESLMTHIRPNDHTEMKEQPQLIQDKHQQFISR